MHIKRIHEMEEKLTEIALCEINKGIECVNTAEMGAVIDMIKDLACAEKEAREAKEMEKEEEEEKKENEYFLKMLKEEYGEEEGEKRFYDNYRYKSSGRFAPKGRGSYMPRGGRRGYEEPPYYHMNPEMYKEHDPEWYRDMDRQSRGVMYFSSPMGGNMGGGNSSANSGNSSGGDTKSYTDGYNDGNRRGYEEGYRDGEKTGKNKVGNSRYEMAKRGYQETKAMHKGNTPEDKQIAMRDAEKMLNVVFDEIDEMLEDAPQELKNMVKTKGLSRFQKIQ